jgi:tight adherence protein B
VSGLRRGGLVAVAALLCAAAASAATPAAAPTIVEAGGASYPSKAYILTLPKAKSLSRSDVRVTENGKPVQGLAVAHQGAQGNQTAVVLALDASASMQGRPIEDAVAAARAFVAHMTDGEQVAIVTFNDKVNVVQPFSTDKNKVLSALDSIPKLAVGTKIYDALDSGASMIGDAGVSNGSIVLLSDGTDVGSKATRGAVLDELKSQHVRVFPVGLVSKQFNKKGLQGIATASRGQFAAAADPSELASIYATLGRRLANEYLLTYTTLQNPNQTVKVIVAVKGLPAAATSYTTPPLHIVPAKPYEPSTTEKVIQSGYTAVVVALLAALLLGYAVAHLFATKSEPLVERVGDFVSVQRDAPVAEPETPAARPSRRSGFISRMTERRSESSWSARMRETFELAGIEAEPSQVIALTALATILMVFLLGLLIGPIGVLIGLTIPLFVRWLIKRRVAKTRRTFAEQLPDNLDVLASALRAGHSLVSALAVVADDAHEPSRGEFRRVLTEEQFGVQLEDAFKTTVVRMENADLEQVALVARLQREMGSNSAEVLDKVIETVRGRQELRRLVRTLTAQGRLSRWILTLLPISLALVLTLISSSYMHPLFHTLPGQLLMVLSGCMVALGSWIIGKIVDIKV